MIVVDASVGVLWTQEPHQDPRAKAAALLQMVEEAERSVLDVGPLAEQHGLPAYDATYLELAQRRGATLLTEDATSHAAGVAALGKKNCLRLAEAQERWGAQAQGVLAR